MGQVEVSGVGVDATNNQVWLSDWVSSFYLYRYDLSDGKYTGKLHLLPSPQWHQGIAVYQDHLFITADDGNADRREHDNLWTVELPQRPARGGAHDGERETRGEVLRAGAV